MDTHIVRKINFPLQQNGFLNAILVDRVARRRVDSGHKNAEGFQNLAYTIVGGWAITDWSVAK